MEKNKLILSPVWEKFSEQELHTGDILYTNKGLAFVDSGYTTGEPSRISSIPEIWSFSFENNGINKRKRDEFGSEYIDNEGNVFASKYNGFDKVLNISQIIRVIG